MVGIVLGLANDPDRLGTASAAIEKDVTPHCAATTPVLVREVAVCAEFEIHSLDLLRSIAP
jgi:hypothetical protein